MQINQMKFVVKFTSDLILYRFVLFFVYQLFKWAKQIKIY